MVPTKRKLARLAAGALTLIALASVGYVVIAGASSSGPRGVSNSIVSRSDKSNPRAPARLVFVTRPDDGLDEFTMQINAERVTVVDDPAGRSARNVLRFDVRQSDVGPTENPRAQLETPADFEEGDDRYVGFSYYLAPSFPTRLPTRAWVALGSVAYGPPYNGAGPLGIRVQNAVDGGGAELRWQRNDTYGYDIPWRGPKVASVRGRWIDFVARVKLHHSPQVGFVELWMNTGSGWRQQRLAGRNRLRMATFDESNDGGPNNSRLSLYYRKDIPGPLTVYHGGLRIASAGQGAFRAVVPSTAARRR